MSGVEAVM